MMTYMRAEPTLSKSAPLKRAPAAVLRRMRTALRTACAVVPMRRGARSLT